jgi:hypothetical protein
MSEIDTMATRCGACGKMAVALDEADIRQWFKTVELAQARDTFRVVEGILEMREASKPKRVRRKDAGKPRNDGNIPLIGNLGGAE